MGKGREKSEQILYKLLANPAKSRYTNTARFDGRFVMQTYGKAGFVPPGRNGYGIPRGGGRTCLRISFTPK